MSTDDKTRIVSASEGVGPGTQLNGIFEIDEHIAFGGMGEVYRGHNIQTDDPVAIKIVLPEFARDKTMLALFRKEASILSHLANDAIVRYHVFTIDPTIGRPYLAMEYVDGVSLADFITRGPMSADTVRRLISRVASGLSAAHAAGVVHRDLSPDNVILPGGKVEKAKIIDFGIAKSATVGGGTLLGGKFAGKYNFVSPEQLGDFGGEITARSDIYSLGLVMAAALRGEALDMGGSQVDVIEKRRRMPDISNLDPSLRPLLETMLQPDPYNRPESMDAVVQWLKGPAQPSSGSVPPVYSNEPTRIARDSSSWQGLPAPGEKSASPRASTPPLRTGSAGPTSIAPAYAAAPRVSMPAAGSFPLGGSIPPIGSVPPLQPSSVPPTSESPFGPFQPPAAPAWTPPATATRKPASRSLAVLYAGAAVAILAMVGGVAFMTGMFNGPAGPAGAPASGPAVDGATNAATADTARAETPPMEPRVETPPIKPKAETPPIEPKAEPPPAAATGGEDVAINTRPAETTTPAETPDNAITPVAWLNDYGGGSCFYATATSVSDTAIEIEGFGRSAAPFEQMVAKFKESHKVEPTMGVRLIEPKQCAVADFLQALRNSPAKRPELALGSAVIKSGQALSGTLRNLDGRKTDVLLVDNAGVVYSLNAHLKQAAEKATFKIKLGLKTDAPVPQMIIAVTSPNGLTTTKVENPVLAETLFPKILNEINSKNVSASATAKYFKLGG